MKNFFKKAILLTSLISLVTQQAVASENAYYTLAKNYTMNAVGKVTNYVASLEKPNMPQWESIKAKLPAMSDISSWGAENMKKATAYISSMQMPSWKNVYADCKSFITENPRTAAIYAGVAAATIGATYGAYALYKKLTAKPLSYAIINPDGTIRQKDHPLAQGVIFKDVTMITSKQEIIDALEQDKNNIEQSDFRQSAVAQLNLAEYPQEIVEKVEAFAQQFKSEGNVIDFNRNKSLSKRIEEIQAIVKAL